MQRERERERERGRQAGRQIDRQTHRHTDSNRETGIQRGTQRERERERERERDRDRDRDRDRQTDRQTDSQRERTRVIKSSLDHSCLDYLISGHPLQVLRIETAEEVSYGHVHVTVCNGSIILGCDDSLTQLLQHLHTPQTCQHHSL